MIQQVTQRKEELEELCLKSGVLRLGLFGSAATGDEYNEDSDLDFVVEFEVGEFEAYADAYFGLLESLERLFGRPVDLVIGSAIRNPYFLEEVETTVVPIVENESFPQKRRRYRQFLQ